MNHVALASSLFAVAVACAVAVGGGGCGDGDPAAHDAAVTGDAGADSSAPTTDVTVTAFDGARIYFGGEGQREIAADVDFPPRGPWERVTLRLALSCPPGGCDPWDRIGSIGLMDGDVALELARFATPYGVGGSWTFDVTDLQPLLAGPRTMHAYIDTWVDSGWEVTADFDFEAGTPARTPVEVIPLSWRNRERLDRDRVVYGDPARPITEQLAPETVPLPAAGFTASELFVITTGHGQGNADNCAEFCPRDHTVFVDGVAHTRTIWRDDCAENPIDNQAGTWQYDRAGWCPGADVRPWIEDLADTLTPGSAPVFTYDVETYENTCRPDSAECTGCVFGTSCNYNDSSHTEPTYLVSAYLILFAS